MVVSNICFFCPYLGRWSNLTNIFQMGCKPPPRYTFVCLDVFFWKHEPLFNQRNKNTAGQPTSFPWLFLLFLFSCLAHWVFLQSSPLRKSPMGLIFEIWGSMMLLKLTFLTLDIWCVGYMFVSCFVCLAKVFPTSTKNNQTFFFAI